MVMRCGGPLVESATIQIDDRTDACHTPFALIQVTTPPARMRFIKGLTEGRLIELTISCMLTFMCCDSNVFPAVIVLDSGEDQVYEKRNQPTRAKKRRSTSTGKVRNSSPDEHQWSMINLLG